MKKTLLIVSLALATVMASAQQPTEPALQGTTKKECRLKAPAKSTLHKINVPKGDKPLLDPQGEDEGYIMTYTENNGFYSQDYTNGKVYVRKSADGDTYYFNGLTPGGNRSYKGAPESWIEGTKDGSEIVIKAGQVLVENQSKKLYLEVVSADSDGNITEFKKETRLTIGSNGELTAPEGDILAIFEDAEKEEDTGFYGFFYSLELKPMGDFVRWEFPEGSKPSTYVFTGTDAYGTTSSRFVKLAFSGSKFYISGLSSKSPDEVYEGTVSGSTATIPSFQIVKDADLFYYRIVPVTVDADQEASMLYSIDFNLSADRHTLTLSPENAYLCETTYDLKQFVTTASGVTMKYYAGDRAAKPATPTDLQWDSNNDALIFNIPSYDTDGEYINPAKLSYRFYVDYKPYTFTPADYERLSEDMTTIPYNFTDNFDIVNNGTQKIVYFHNLDAKRLQVESVYTVDGVATASDRALYDFDPTAISDNTAAKLPVATSYFSLQGARLASPLAGTIVLKQTVFADGSKQTEKLLVK